jgi:hypothetical protein
MGVGTICVVLKAGPYRIRIAARSLLAACVGLDHCHSIRVDEQIQQTWCSRGSRNSGRMTMQLRRGYSRYVAGDYVYDIPSSVILANC